jgi:hypothetical protein
MSVKSQQVSRSSIAKRDQAMPDVENRVRGFPGNHTIMRKRSPRETPELQRDEAASYLPRNENEERSYQRQLSNGETDLSTAPPIVNEVLRGPGQPLEPTTRRLMETRMGQDFSGVRVHTDARAAKAAEAIDSRAYTTNHDIVFGEREYSPQTESGRRLLAHELTHVVQQRSGAQLPGGIVPANDARERNADAVATEVTQGSSIGNSLRGATVVGGASTWQQGGRTTAVSTAGVAGAGKTYSTARNLGGSTIQRSPLERQARKLKRELQELIDHATWKEIRKRVYPKESAAGIKRAKKRRRGKLPDLTGLGSIKALDHFARAVHDIRKKWKELQPDERVQELGKAANEELVSADVPGFLALDKEPMEFKGFFQPFTWKFVISQELVTDNRLSRKDAEELANTTMHESRHAEQHFLAARFSAGNGSTAGDIVLEQGIPQVIANAAVAKKFDATTDAAVADLGQRMFQAMITEGDANAAINADKGLVELAAARSEAQFALNILIASATTQTIADATAKRDALIAAIAHREERYAAYRQIPYEADSHEVGDSGGLAFKRTR